MKKFLMKFLAYWGILSRQNQKQRRVSKKGIHLQRLARDATIMLQAHTSTGATPLLPSVYNVEVVEVPPTGFLLKSKLDWTQNA